MTWLIDAEQAEKVLSEYYHLKTETQHKALREALDMVPTIDAVPVKRGKWIIRDNPGTGWYRVTCSECGEDVTANAPCIGFFPNAKVIWNYCPECGAYMKGTEDD